MVIPRTVGTGAEPRYNGQGAIVAQMYYGSFPTKMAARCSLISWDSSRESAAVTRRSSQQPVHCRAGHRDCRLNDFDNNCSFPPSSLVPEGSSPSGKNH